MTVQGSIRRRLVSDFLDSARSLMTVDLSIQTHGPKPSRLVVQVTTGDYWAAVEVKSIGHVRLRSPPKASQESNRLSTDLPGQSAYLGVGIVVTMPPGAISVLVPLPLLVKSPWPARTMAATAIVQCGHITRRSS